MNWDKSHVAVGVVSAVVSGVVVAAVQFVTFGATYGRLSASVEAFGKRIDGVEERMATVEKKAVPLVRKGDLCSKLVGAQVDALKDGDTFRQRDAEAQLTKMDCYDGITADAMKKVENTSE